MRAHKYTETVSKNFFSLLYSTCTNDLFIKQSNNIEFFVVAFFIEFHQLFIADSLLMNALQKHFILKVKSYVASKKSAYDNFVTDNRNVFLEVLECNNIPSNFNKMRIFDKSNSENYSFSKFF